MKICQGARGILFYIALVAVPGVACLARLMIKSRTLHLSYALSIEERARGWARAELCELEVEHAAAASPARLLTLASELGMVPPPAPRLARLALDAQATSFLRPLPPDAHAAE